MSTKPELAKEIAVANDDVLGYPYYKVVSVFYEPDTVMAAINDLEAAGFTSDVIEAFCGWGGLKEASYKGTNPGIWENFVHAAKHVGPERTYLERYEKHLQDGDCIIMVKVDNKETKAKAAEILHRHTNERVTYFGLLMADEIK
ncbi:MAG: hypothetical protein ABL999_07185 [Pyrinomonadaceae bacterium]